MEGNRKKRRKRTEQRKGMGNEDRNEDQGIREGIKNTGDKKKFRSRRRREKRITN